MKAVVLASGGLDSALMMKLAAKEGADLYPLFIDYGQRAAERERLACERVCRRLSLREPVRMDLSGYGKVIPSGLTDASLDVYADAFLPGRNILMLVAAAGYAYSVGARHVLMGLLTQQSAIFPDQTDHTINLAAEAASAALGLDVSVVLPLRDFDKRSVVALAKREGLDGTYSCHEGGERPCERCISCREFMFDEAESESEGGHNGRK